MQTSVHLVWNQLVNSPRLIFVLTFLLSWGRHLFLRIFICVLAIITAMLLLCRNLAVRARLIRKPLFSSRTFKLGTLESRGQARRGLAFVPTVGWKTLSRREILGRRRAWPLRDHLERHQRFVRGTFNCTEKGKNRDLPLQYLGIFYQTSLLQALMKTKILSVG